MRNKTWRDDIRAYVPFNEQERSDKARFLEMLDLENILTRENEEAHVSASAWVMNETLDQVLMAYHNIYQSYSWLGGHADGDPDLFAVALREAKEEIRSWRRFRRTSWHWISCRCRPISSGASR